MAKWMLYSKRADFRAIAEELGISPVTARVIRNRDVIGAEATRRFLYGTMADLDDPEEIPGMRDAAFVLRRRIVEGKNIRVIGDYDVDGICSSYILWRLITFLGGRVSVAIPDRVRDGYGINERLVREAVDDGVDTIITCDNGIAAAGPLQMAKDAGCTVIVTDHHAIPYREEPSLDGPSGGQFAPPERQYLYPPADVIVEPWIPDERTGLPAARFPSICGAVVVFKLAMLLLGRPDLSGEKSAAEPEHVLAAREMLGFAAIATVCDVMPLQDENRILVRYGLREAARTDNIGLHSLILAAGLADAPLTVYHAGFVIGPCLNASGRLDTAQRALALFQEKNEGRAMRMARDLKQLNDSRKSMTEEGVRAALRRVELDEADGRALSDRRILIVVLKNCHESLAGIIAGRLREQYHRPVIVLTGAENAEEDAEKNTEEKMEGNADESGGVSPARHFLKGSGRSIEAYDMFGELSRCRELFIRFGGHRMAAGLSIEEEKVGELDRRLNENCTLTPEQMQDVLHIDMELPPSCVTPELVREFNLLEPCGNGNPRVLLAARDVTLEKSAVFGKNRNVIRLRGTVQDRRRVEFVWFTPEENLPPAFCMGAVRCHVVYEPQINIWKGRESLQFVIKDVKVL